MIPTRIENEAENKWDMLQSCIALARFCINSAARGNRGMNLHFTFTGPLQDHGLADHCDCHRVNARNKAPTPLRFERYLLTIFVEFSSNTEGCEQADYEGEERAFDHKSPRTFTT